MPRSEELDALDEAIRRQSNPVRRMLTKKVTRKIEAMGECDPRSVQIILDAEAKQLRMERNRRREEANEAERGRQAIEALLRELSAP